MSLTVDDTITALASPPGSAARAVVRISGSSVVDVLTPVFQPADSAAWATAKRPTRFPGRFAVDGLPNGLPCDVLLWPRSSYTGQPAAEIHMIGSPPLVDLVLTSLIANGARPANRGEFTLRAFLAGRLDLTQAEAVLGVIDAEDSSELTTALAQLDGGLSGPLRELHERLLIDLADLEAGLDFADEDLDFVSRNEFAERLATAIEEVNELTNQQHDRGRSVSVETIVLTGPPNAGKSTLLNALAGQDAAIVSDVAGTTRDTIEVTLELAGRLVRVVDTAGTDDGQDPLVAAAERHRQQSSREATLVLYCTSASEPVDQQELDRLRADRPTLHVATKTDLSSMAKQAADHDVAISSQTGDGLGELVAAIAVQLEADASERSQLLAATAARCRGSLLAARERLNAAHDLLQHEAGDELVADELRNGLDDLAAVLGKVYTDDILDRVFTRFCIGK